MNKMFCKASLAQVKMMASTSGLPNVFPIKLCNLDDVLVRVAVNPDLRTYINLHSPTMIPAVTAIHSVFVNEKGGVYATEYDVSHVYTIAFSEKSQDLAMIPQNGHVEAYVAVSSVHPPIIVLKTVNGGWVSATGECTVVGPGWGVIIVRVPNGDPYLIRTGASVSRSMCEKGDAPNSIRLYSRTYTQEVALYEERVAGGYDTPSPQPDPEPEATQPNSIRETGPEVRELSLLRDEITSILDSMVESHELADARTIEGLPYRQSALGFISAASISLKDAIAEFDAISDALRTTSTDFTIQLNG